MWKIGRRGLKMNQALYAHDTPRSRIANYLLYLGSVYVNQGNFEEPLSMDQESLLMKHAVYGHDNSHPKITESLCNLALVDKGEGKHIEVIQFH